MIRRLALPLSLLLLAACTYREPLDGRGQPEIYRGPLTVVAKDHTGATQIHRSEGLRSRTTWIRPQGYSHDLISDGDAQRGYSWSSNGPEVDARNTPRREPRRYWLTPDRTEPGGPCHAAGETGRIWRHTSPPNLKNPEARIGEACLTSDGVVIARYLERFPDGAPALEWEAVSVVRGPLAPDTFTPPSSESGAASRD